MFRLEILLCAWKMFLFQWVFWWGEKSAISFSREFSSLAPGWTGLALSRLLFFRQQLSILVILAIYLFDLYFPGKNLLDLESSVKGWCLHSAPCRSRLMGLSWTCRGCEPGLKPLFLERNGNAATQRPVLLLFEVLKAGFTQVLGPFCRSFLSGWIS